MRVFRKFQSSDGRIKVATLSGVSALVAVIALLVGVLPVFAAEPGPTEDGAVPVPVDWGGGSGACDDVLVSLDDGTTRGPSAAEHELHINNPVPGTSTTYTGPDGTEITITVDANDEFFEFSIGSGMAAYDVVVNGGKKSNHYEYDGGPGIVPSDEHLSAPTKDNKPNEVHKLSHVNLCYDMQTVEFVCDTPQELEGEGLITDVTAEIFTNSVEGTFDCSDSKEAFYFLDNDTVTLDFGADEEPKVAGRLDFTKDFGDPTVAQALEYDRDDSGTFLEVQWCDVRDEATGDGAQFDIELESETRYPSLVGVKDTDGSSATACKVFEDLNAEGVQHTVVYFEFVDPQFR